MTRAINALKVMLTTIALVGFVGACGSKEEPKTGEAPKTEEGKANEGTTDEAKKDEPQAEGKTDPQLAAIKGMAKTVITAYKAKDLAKLAEFAPAQMKEMITALKPGSKEYDRLFDPTNWRWKAAEGWDGKIHDAKMKGDDKAWVHYANISPEEYAVLEFRKVDGTWLFRDFKSPSKERYDSWGAAEK